MSTRLDHHLRTSLGRLAHAADAFFNGSAHDTGPVERTCREVLELMREREWSAKRARTTCIRVALARSRASGTTDDIRRAQLAACFAGWCANACLADAADQPDPSIHIECDRRTA